MIDIQINNLDFSYLNGRVLHDISLSVTPGEMVALLGPNGSGKTTLIKLVSGVLKPEKGTIMLGDQDLNRLKRKYIASRIAVVPQQFHIPFAFTVSEVVMLGRIPFIRTFTGETAADHQAASAAIELAGIDHITHRRFDELSGGERQRVILAMALAQQPRLLLLDEPIVHLDISHQIETLELVRKLNTEEKITVMAAMHDLNLASLYFDRLILLDQGRIHAQGTPAQVLTEDRIREIFNASVRIEPHPATGVPHIIIMPVENKQV